MSRKRILVVEDEPNIATPLIDALKGENLDPSIAETISEARKAYKKNTFDAIILDVKLPDGNGFDFCEEIRLNDRVTPIIFATSYTEDLQEVRGVTMGADDYVKKPYNPLVVALKIKRIVTRVTGTDITPSKSNSLLDLDDDKRRITFKGKDLKLVKKEYEILKFLINRSGKVYTRDEILKNCWDKPESVTDGVVYTHIRSIRRKLKDIAPNVNPNKDILITHIGGGFFVKE
jgi:two-component system catabolic regulation response regulator CreB